MRRYRLPLTVSRDWYVTEVGGHTSELGPREVGINGEALEQNTSLEAGDLVRIRPFEDRAHPVFRRDWYRVVAIEDVHEDGIALSRHGEAALPLEETGVKAREDLIINATRPMSN